MFGKLSSFSKFGLHAILMLFISGCEGPQGPAGPAGSQPLWIEGYIQISNQALPKGSAYLTVLNCPVIPSVKINDLSIPYNGHGFYTYDLLIAPGQPAELTVIYTKPDNSQGFAGASISMPGMFEITSHNPDSTLFLPKGADLVVAWSASEHASAYDIYCSVSYRYGDFNDSTRSGYFSFDTLMSETSITIPARRIFPDIAEIDTLKRGSGSLYIDAKNGPIYEGDAENVSGDGNGYFIGRTRCDRLYIEVVDSNQ